MYWLNGEMAVSLLVEAGEIEREVLGSLERRQPERHRIINAPMYAEVYFRRLFLFMFNMPVGGIDLT
jgi:hypothetical protein